MHKALWYQAISTVTSILCVGGAISIDRKYRQDAWEQYKLKHRIQKSDDLFAKNYYWLNEAPTIDFSALERINAECTIDTVITHTAPSFCELQSKNGLCCYAYDDNSLINDVTEERAIMDKIYNMLKHQNHPLTHWCYGHFHQSWHASIEGTLFKMLDIMEMYEIRWLFGKQDWPERIGKWRLPDVLSWHLTILGTANLWP